LTNGVWVDVSSTKYDYSGIDNSGFVDKSDSSFMLAMAGYDRIIDKFLFGIAVGWEETETDFTSNLFTTKHRGDGYTIVPYIAFNLLEWLVIDGMVSYSKTDTNFTPAGPDAVGYGPDTFDSVRTSYAMNINLYHKINILILNPYIGYLHSKNKQGRIDARVTAPMVWGTKFSSNFKQWKVGMNVYCAISDKIECYGGVAYFKEFSVGGTSISKSRDDDEVEGGLGLNFNINDRFQVGLNGVMSFGRSDTDAARIGINLGYIF